MKKKSIPIDDDTREKISLKRTIQYFCVNLKCFIKNLVIIVFDIFSRSSKMVSTFLSYI